MVSDCYASCVNSCWCLCRKVVDADVGVGQRRRASILWLMTVSSFDQASTHEDPPSPSTVEQEQIQKKTFTNWVNAQLAKVRPEGVGTCTLAHAGTFKLHILGQFERQF